MARACTTVSRRVFSIASSRTANQHHSFRHLSPTSAPLYSITAGLQGSVRKSCDDSLRLTRLSQRRQPLTLSSSRASSSNTTQRSPFAHTRHFASQTDGLGQSETFREYRLRQEIEQRRQTLRELEDGMLRSQIEVADARFHLNLQELASLPVNRPFPSYASSTSQANTPPRTQPIALLKSLTPHENIYTLPNLLTFTRLLAAPLVGYSILTHQPTLALSLFTYAGLTDALDGYLARRFHSSTVVGTIIDPMADKLLMTICVISLSLTHILPVWLAVVVIGRDVGLACSAIYFRWISLPQPKTWRRYWDFSLPSAEVRPTEISKINTLLQLLLIGSAMSLPVLRESTPMLAEAWNLGGVLEGWGYLVGGTTIWSGLSYIGNKDAVKILSKEEGEAEMEGTAKEEGPLYRRK